MHSKCGENPTVKLLSLRAASLLLQEAYDQQQSDKTSKASPFTHKTINNGLEVADDIHAGGFAEHHLRKHKESNDWR